MADSEIPLKLLHAIRQQVWNALPFILLLVGIERIFDGNWYQVAGCFAAALLSIFVPVYWERLLPRWWRPATVPPLTYLHDEDSELGGAIRDMAWCSAWAKWFASQTLATNNHRPASEEYVMQTATHLVLDALTDGRLEAFGRRPGQLDYEPIPRTHWRSTALHMIADGRTIWKMILIPRGGAEMHAGSTVMGHNQEAVQRTDQLVAFDNLIVSSRQFENLWPRRDKKIDTARKTLLKRAKKAGADPAEIKKLSQD